ncbi:unnamed protein product [Orchesella dallaii]|uniref:Uncharacterized protein n=1 Tax=Orchesella dallaii TaxID=48710 RepID=A0ABP1PXS6_9HEXA
MGKQKYPKHLQAPFDLLAFTVKPCGSVVEERFPKRRNTKAHLLEKPARQASSSESFESVLVAEQ